jgi:hypothetical protein
MKVILLNAGLPMIVSSMMEMVIALIPIILLEAFCFHSSLKVTFWNVLKSSAVVNIFSTLIGIPVTWAFLILLRYLTNGGRPFNLKSQPLLIKFLLFIWASSRKQSALDNLRIRIGFDCAVFLRIVLFRVLDSCLFFL